MTDTNKERATNESPENSIPPGHVHITKDNIPAAGTPVWFRSESQWVWTRWSRWWNPKLTIYVLDQGVDLNTGTTISEPPRPMAELPERVREAMGWLASNGIRQDHSDQWKMSILLHIEQQAGEIESLGLQLYGIEEGCSEWEQEAKAAQSELAAIWKACNGEGEPGRVLALVEQQMERLKEALAENDHTNCPAMEMLQKLCARQAIIPSQIQFVERFLKERGAYPRR